MYVPEADASSLDLDFSPTRGDHWQKKKKMVTLQIPDRHHELETNIAVSKHLYRTRPVQPLATQPELQSPTSPVRFRHPI